MKCPKTLSFYTNLKYNVYIIAMSRKAKENER